MLHEWKARREGDHGPELAALGPLTEQQLTDLLLGAFTPPLDRLQQITEQLEKTGALTTATVAELRQIVDMLTHTAASTDAAAALSNAADVLSAVEITSAADALLSAADILGSQSLRETAGAITQAAELLQLSVEELKRYGGQL